MPQQLLLCAAVFFLLAEGAGAQEIMIGPSAGYQRSRGSDGGEFLGGLALRMKAFPSLGVEGSILYRKERFENNAVTVRSWPVMATAMFFPVPYLYASAGGGWFHTTFDYSDELNEAGTEDETTSEFGWHFGGGVEIPVGYRLRLAGDIRYVFLDYDFEGLPGRDINSNFYMITVGVLFRLF